MKAQSGGFTIIELSIFLAISGMLLLIVVGGTGSTIASIRFSDSIRSLQSYFQGQYGEILNGVNTRSGQEICNAGVVSTTSNSTPGQSRCLLLGKLMQFNQVNTDVATYYVVGSEPAVPLASGASDEAILNSYKPHAVQNVGAQTYSVPWGPLRVGLGAKEIKTNTAIDSYLLLHSPSSGNILSYVFNSAGFPANGDLTPYVNPIPAVRLKTNVAANVCIKSADNVGSPAMISLAAGGGQSGVTLTILDTAAQVVQGCS